MPLDPSWGDDDATIEAELVKLFNAQNSDKVSIPTYKLPLTHASSQDTPLSTEDIRTLVHILDMR